MDDFESPRVRRLRSFSYSQVETVEKREYACSCGCGMHRAGDQFIGGAVVVGCKNLGHWKRVIVK